MYVDFTDSNGIIITPGVRVQVAVQTRTGIVFRKGMVTVTKIRRQRRSLFNGPAITLREPETLTYIGTYRNPKAMIVME
jgi:hypothetical protein